MLGNLILWMREVWKQQTCVHTYEWIYRKDNGNSFENCSKCDLVKN